MEKELDIFDEVLQKTQEYFPNETEESLRIFSQEIVDVLGSRTVNNMKKGRTMYNDPNNGFRIRKKSMKIGLDVIMEASIQNHEPKKRITSEIFWPKSTAI